MGGALARLGKRLIESSYLEWFRPFVEIEADADSMIEYEAQAVPGLLRTEDYAALCCGWDEP
ncbi:Scr1 family TA system antitoxin-like transcriptional regulator [Actinomadura formosensis]|uniref:Scr1 family TA system antitoxin-like transcriptional regulator n=1 Tax=Actinomadura formosensis TaxID=60706 RepID=UPI000833BD98